MTRQWFELRLYCVILYREIMLKLNNAQALPVCNAIFFPNSRGMWYFCQFSSRPLGWGFRIEPHIPVWFVNRGGWRCHVRLTEVQVFIIVFIYFRLLFVTCASLASAWANSNYPRSCRTRTSRQSSMASFCTGCCRPRTASTSWPSAASAQWRLAAKQQHLPLQKWFRFL